MKNCFCCSVLNWIRTISTTRRRGVWRKSTARLRGDVDQLLATASHLLGCCGPPVLLVLAGSRALRLSELESGDSRSPLTSRYGCFLVVLHAAVRLLDLHACVSFARWTGGCPTSAAGKQLLPASRRASACGLSRLQCLRSTRTCGRSCASLKMSFNPRRNNRAKLDRASALQRCSRHPLSINGRRTYFFANRASKLTPFFGSCAGANPGCLVCCPQPGPCPYPPGAPPPPPPMCVCGPFPAAA